MTNSGRPRAALAAALLMPCFLALAGCRAYLVRTTVVNRTGAVVNLLEVDYPSASFGVDSMAPGAQYHQRLQFRDQGPLTVAYTGAQRHQYTVTGPTLYEKQQGSLEIDLLPGGKVEFHAHLTPPPSNQ